MAGYRRRATNVTNLLSSGAAPVETTRGSMPAWRGVCGGAEPFAEIGVF